MKNLPQLCFWLASAPLPLPMSAQCYSTRTSHRPPAEPSLWSSCRRKEASTIPSPSGMEGKGFGCVLLAGHVLLLAFSVDSRHSACVSFYAVLWHAARSLDSSVAWNILAQANTDDRATNKRAPLNGRTFGGERGRPDHRTSSARSGAGPRQGACGRTR